VFVNYGIYVSASRPVTFTVYPKEPIPAKFSVRYVWSEI